MENHRHSDSAGMGGRFADEASGATPQGFWKSRASLVTVGFLLIAAFLLVSEHRAHAFGYLAFLLIFGCLFMHMFMHGGHGGHSGHDERPPAVGRPKPPSQGA